MAFYYNNPPSLSVEPNIARSVVTNNKVEEIATYVNNIYHI